MARLFSWSLIFGFLHVFDVLNRWLLGCIHKFSVQAKFLVKKMTKLVILFYILCGNFIKQK